MPPLDQHESSAEQDDQAIGQVQISTLRRIENCVGGVMHGGLDVGRGTLNLGAYAIGGVIGTVQEIRRAYDKGLGRKPYSNTKA